MRNKKIIRLLLIIAIAFLTIWYWKDISGFISLLLKASVPLFLGCIIAYALNILMTFFEKIYDKLFRKKRIPKLKRIICLLLAFLSVGFIIMFVSWMIVPELIKCISLLINKVPGEIEKLVNTLNGDSEISQFIKQSYKKYVGTSINLEKYLEGVINVIKSGATGVVNSFITTISSIFSIIITALVGIIFSIYLLFGKEKLASQNRRLVKTYCPKTYDKLNYILMIVNDSFHDFIVGQCLEAVILGVLCIIGMLICQFPYATMIGVLIGFTALIPVAGAYIGALTGALMILTVSPVKALWFLAFIIVLQQIEGNIIYPKVVGKSIGLPGIWVLAAVTIGGGLLGILGMLLAVPLSSAIYKMLKNDIDYRNSGFTKENEIEFKINNTKF